MHTGRCTVCTANPIKRCKIDSADHTLCMFSYVCCLIIFRRHSLVVEQLFLLVHVFNVLPCTFRATSNLTNSCYFFADIPINVNNYWMFSLPENMHTVGERNRTARNTGKGCYKCLDSPVQQVLDKLQQVLHPPIMSILLRLPAELACVVVSEWLKLREIACLDSSYCSEEERPTFLESVLGSPFCVVRCESYSAEKSSLIKWLMRRDLRVAGLRTSTFTVKACVEYSQRFGISIMYVEFYESNLSKGVRKNLLFAIGLNCIHLTSMICVSCKIDESILSILRHCSKLDTFLLVHCFDDFGGTSDAFDYTVPVISKLTRVSIDIWGKSQNSLHSAISAIHYLLAQSPIRRLYISDSLDAYMLPNWSSCGETVRCFGYTGSINALEGGLMGTIALFPNILHLDLSRTDIIDENIYEVAHQLTQLQTINLSYCDITDESLAALADYRKDSLQGLYAQNCHNLTAAGFNAILQHCQQLHSLGINLVSPLTDSLNTSLLGKIRTLQIEWTENNEANAILPYFHRLENLYIEGEYGIYRRYDLLLLSNDRVPCLRQIILCGSRSSCYGHAFSVRECSNKLRNEKASIDTLLSQRPHLHIRYELARDWPSNFMNLPV